MSWQEIKKVPSSAISVYHGISLEDKLAHFSYEFTMRYHGNKYNEIVPEGILYKFVNQHNVIAPTEALLKVIGCTNCHKIGTWNNSVALM